MNVHKAATTVMTMQSAVIPLEVLSAHVLLDTKEMESIAQVRSIDLYFIALMS